MTDREPDDFYDALRDRLADYGQEPSAPLWAGIRAQLPPPVARPQLRRKRRWAPVALLALLVTIGSGAGWYWWQSRHPAGAAATAPIAASAAGRLLAEAAGAPAATPDAPTGAGRTSASSKAKESMTAAPTAPQNRSAAVDLGSLPAASSLPPWAAVTESAAAQSSTAPRIPRHSSEVPSGSKRRLATSVTEAAPPSKRTGLNGLWAAVSNESRQSLGRKQGHHAEHAAAQADTGAPQFSSSVAKRSRELANNLPTGAITVAPAFESTSSPFASVQNQVDAVATTPGTTNGIHLPQAAGGQATETSLLSRLVALRLAAWPDPAAPQPVAVGHLPPMPAAARWTVQAMAGPALTYRYLGAAPAAGGTPGSFYPLASANEVAHLERPALGGGAQVSVRRTLTAHWNLSAGLGYAEYAARLALRQVHPSYSSYKAPPGGKDSSTTTSIHRRDTYRFATVPLRVGYAWAPAGRWRVGVLAGADAAIYVGGNSTEGSNCACQTQTWGLTGSPYRRMSLGASLGAEVRYRFNGRLELLAQPTATYLLTPLAQLSAYYPRHLFGGVALLGMSYDLP